LQSDSVRNAPHVGARAAVIDIDGTLTPDVMAVFRVRERAAEVTNAMEAAGVQVIYLTARVPAFQFLIPGWLERHGFPEGSVHVTESDEHREDFVAFKSGVVDAWQAAGWNIVIAVGDSSSDFEAYALSGVEEERVFAVQREGATSCQAGPWARCFDSWHEIAEFLAGDDKWSMSPRSTEPSAKINR
jgi:hypothetical protein